MRYVDPTVDLCFKRIFSKKRLLIRLLNDTMELPESSMIEDLEYISTEKLPLTDKLRQGMFDIKCRDASGKEFIIEMQRERTGSFLERMQYYGCSAVSDQLFRGEPFNNIYPVVVVVITKYFSPLKDKDLGVITYHTMNEKEKGKCYLDKLSYVFIDLQKFNKTEEELSSFKDHWLYFLKRCEYLTEPPKSLDDEDILDAYETSSRFKLRREEASEYGAAIAKIRENFLELKAKKEEGIQEGMQKGVQKGKKEGKEDVAKAMLAKGYPLKEIREMTQIPMDALIEWQEQQPLQDITE